jgi:hypothetical protein
MAKIEIYLSRDFPMSLSYNPMNSSYDTAKALKNFDNGTYEKVFETDFVYDPKKKPEIYLDGTFLFSQNEDGRNWNPFKSSRSTSVGDIFLLSRDEKNYVYIVAPISFQLLKIF